MTGFKKKDIVIDQTTNGAEIEEIVTPEIVKKCTKREWIKRIVIGVCGAIAGAATVILINAFSNGDNEVIDGNAVVYDTTNVEDIEQ